MRALVGIAAVVVAAALPGRTDAVAGTRPHVTNRCPTNALPLRRSDLPSVLKVGLAVAQHGIHKVGGQTVDYRGARAKASFPTFFTGYVRTACPRAFVRRVIARTADVTVSYPRITWSASLSSSRFLVSRTPRGFVAWAQLH